MDFGSTRTTSELVIPEDSLYELRDRSLDVRYFPHSFRVDNEILARKTNSNVFALYILLPKSILCPKEMSRKRMVNTYIPTNGIIQLMIIVMKISLNRLSLSRS